MDYVIVGASCFVLGVVLSAVIKRRAGKIARETIADLEREVSKLRAKVKI